MSFREKTAWVMLVLLSAAAPADERERIILDKAGNWSGYVLAVGAVSGALHDWSQSNGAMMFHLVVAGLMLSHVSEYAFRIWLFRRGGV